MEVQENLNQLQKSPPVIEIKPEAERSEDIKLKPEDLGETIDHVEEMRAEFVCVNKFKPIVLQCEVKDEPALESIVANQTTNVITENPTSESSMAEIKTEFKYEVKTEMAEDKINNSQPLDMMSKNQLLYPGLEQESLKQMIEEVVEDCERLVAAGSKKTTSEGMKVILG